MSEPKFLGCIDNQIFLSIVLLCARESICYAFIEIGLLQAVDLLSSTGDLKLKLNKLIRPCSYPSRCGTNKDPSIIASNGSNKKDQYIDLFSTGRKTGWWACNAGKKLIVSVYLYYIFFFQRKKLLLLNSNRN